MQETIKNAAAKLYRIPPGYGFRPIAPKTYQNRRRMPDELPQRNSVSVYSPQKIQRESFQVSQAQYDLRSPQSSLTKKESIETVLPARSSTHLSSSKNSYLSRQKQKTSLSFANQQTKSHCDTNTPKPSFDKKTSNIPVSFNVNEKPFTNSIKTSTSEQSDHGDALLTELISVDAGGGDNESIAVESVKNSAAKHLNMLKMKQKVMETVMRKLLQSLKEIKTMEKMNGNDCETDKERRLKVTRMMQLLMLQRKNLQMQTEALSTNLCTLRKKHQILRKHSEGCILENIEMSKTFNQLRCDLEKKDAKITALVELGTKLQKQLDIQTGAEIKLENTEFELKRMKIDNENLKEAHNELRGIFSEKVKERECTSLLNTQLHQELDRSRAELTNVRMRCEKINKENQLLRNQLVKSDAGSKDLCLKKVEIEQLREQYDILQFDHQRLKGLYIFETETRRALHNQLQEVSGNIRVICRVRPFSGVAKSTPLEFCAMDKLFVTGRSHPITQIYRRQLGLDQPIAYMAKDECFSFNRVFQQNATQSDIFEEIQPLIGSFLDGYNVCILAYGPTGSGKTYSMQGTKSEPGISSRSINELFELCKPLQGVWNIDISVAMFEIHNEIIYDLLGQHIHPIRLSDNGSDVRLIDAEEKVTKSEEEILYWIEKGYMRRKMTATKLNVESSRSHLIIRLQLCLTSTIDCQKRASTLVFCDLAGSESAERIDASGSLHIETGFINKSLVTLARVFETLRKRTVSGAQLCFANLAIPYRDSKLTHLLKPCLGGQAKCVLLVTASPESTHLDRTLKALEFAQRAMQVALGKPKNNSRILVTRSS